MVPPPAPQRVLPTKGPTLVMKCVTKKKQAIKNQLLKRFNNEKTIITLFISEEK
jgi:hypothetical protein